MEVTHLGCATVHQLVACFLLMHSRVDPVRNIARGIHHLSPEPFRSLMLIKHRPSHLTQGPVFPFHNTILGRCIRTQNKCSRPKSWQKVSKREFLNSEPLSLRLAHMESPCLSFLNLKTRSNKTKRLPFLLKKEHPCIPRVVVHHNKDIPLPTRRSHTSWANKVHMEKLAWTLSHRIGERRVRRGYHLGMPTRRTNQLFLKPQPWKSSDQIEFTQARQKVKAQVIQLLMPLPQLTRRASQETMLKTRRQRKISSKHLTSRTTILTRSPRESKI
jgi:hypothetical protein